MTAGVRAVRYTIVKMIINGGETKALSRFVLLYDSSGMKFRLSCMIYLSVTVTGRLLFCKAYCLAIHSAVPWYIILL
jgi:hypothetical protein